MAQSEAGTLTKEILFGMNILSLAGFIVMGLTLFDELRSIVHSPDFAPAFVNRCLATAMVNQFQEAMADCGESLRLRPGEAGALSACGLVHAKLKELDLALADYDAALRVDPKNAFCLYGRGMAKQLMGDKAGADADIAAAKQIYPDIAGDFQRYLVAAP